MPLQLRKTLYKCLMQQVSDKYFKNSQETTNQNRRSQLQLYNCLQLPLTPGQNEFNMKPTIMQKVFGLLHFHFSLFSGENFCLLRARAKEGCKNILVSAVNKKVPSALLRLAVVTQIPKLNAFPAWAWGKSQRFIIQC